MKWKLKKIIDDVYYDERNLDSLTVINHYNAPHAYQFFLELVIKAYYLKLYKGASSRTFICGKYITIFNYEESDKIEIIEDWNRIKAYSCSLYIKIK